MGITAQGKLLLIKSFLNTIQSCTFHCSGDVQVKNCPFFCQPIIENNTVKLVIAVSVQKCVQAGVKDGKTKFNSYTLYSNNVPIYQGTLSGMKKPANAGLIITINLSIGAF